MIDGGGNPVAKHRRVATPPSLATGLKSSSDTSSKDGALTSEWYGACVVGLILSAIGDVQTFEHPAEQHL